MPAERIAMRQVRDVLRLNAAGVSGNEIARRVGVASSTVRLTLKRLAAAGLSWPLPADMTDPVLEGQLFTAAGKKQGHRRRTEPDWAAVHRELKRKHVTLQILWDEYIEQNPDGYRYSRFCELYRGWASRISVTMRQTHAGGDKLFVDYAGDTVPVIVDRLTGKTRPAQIFVAVMGASNFTYAEASWTQALADWIGAHTRAFEAIGGVPNLLVPDNTKVAVIKACLYEPQVNRTYAEMAAHYDTAILPARPRRPRDKAKVEAAVLIVERWLLGRLRHRRFYSLAELNTAIGEMLRQLNEERPIRRLGVTRRALARGTRSAPPQGVARRALCLCRMAAAPGRHRLPRRGRGALLQRALPLRPQRSRGAADAAHRRDFPEGRARSPRICAPAAITGTPPCPSTCRRATGGTPIGPSSAFAARPLRSVRRPLRLCELILERRPHPEQGFRSCLGIVRLVRPFGADRVEAAAMRAIEIGTLTYGSMRSILDNKLDRQPADSRPADTVPVLHPNIRGPRYYH